MPVMVDYANYAIVYHNWHGGLKNVLQRNQALIPSTCDYYLICPKV